MLNLCVRRVPSHVQAERLKDGAGALSTPYQPPGFLLIRNAEHVYEHRTEPDPPS